MKNVFLFGAGASHGCGGLNCQVPLGNDLFQALQINFPKTWGKLTLELVSLFNKKFENGMEVIWKKYSGDISILMQDMAVYFSKVIISKVDENLYAKLIKELKTKDLIFESEFSTLNYECLVELAASHNGISVTYSPSSDKANASLMVWKLHGSCNFILDGVRAKRLVKYTAGATFNGKSIKAIQINEVEPYCRDDNALYPAMAIFMKGKPTQIGKAYIEGIQRSWKTRIEKSDKIFIIGVNPDLNDAHIWNPLSTAKSIIYFCGNEDSFKNWQKTKSRNDVYLGNRFQDCFDDIKKHL